MIAGRLVRKPSEGCSGQSRVGMMQVVTGAIDLVKTLAAPI